MLKLLSWDHINCVWKENHACELSQRIQPSDAFHVMSKCMVNLKKA